MFIESTQVRVEAHVEIGTILQKNADALVESWSARAILEQPNAKRVHHAVLHDHLHEFLRTLGRSLAESRDPLNCKHCEPASIHGDQRWDAGWSLPEVVRDFQILRLVVVNFLEESLDRSLAHREVLAIGLALDEAIGASVTTYTRERDQHLQRLEAVRTEELKQRQHELQKQADALRDADRRKDEFLAMLAHELRNPLAPVSHALDILRLQAPHQAELVWARDLIGRQVQHMTRMVDDLLDVSRIARGKVKLQVESVNITTLVTRAVEEIRPRSAGRNHQLTLNLPADPVWVAADPQRLLQVVTNLLNNAIKYTDEGGQIWVTVEQAGDELLVKVRDNGAGIPEHVLPQVFNPFMQEDRLQPRDKGGLGIGLALVRSLVDLHGGKVQAFSAGPGQGSEFVVHLPALAETSQPAEPKKNAPAHVFKRRILVVDDHEDAAQSLKLLLNLHGHDVKVAFNGSSALEMALDHVPEVVLLDIGLPHIDGLEVARRFRADTRMRGVILVAMTGYGQDEDRRRSHEAGFNAHLVKPVELATLHEVLASLVPLDPVDP